MEETHRVIKYRKPSPCQPLHWKKAQGSSCERQNIFQSKKKAEKDSSKSSQLESEKPGTCSSKT